MVSMSRLDSWSKQSVPDDSCAEWSGQPYPGRRRADSLLERMVATRGLQRGVTRARCFRSSTGTRFAVWPHTGVSGSVAAIGARASRQNERVIEGFEIGHHTADSDGWLTGTTVVVAREGAVGGVDVRGGGPGTRETDLLQPMTLVERVHAVVLTGGSAYGLAAADGVMEGLEAAGIGFPAGLEPHQVVPIVPAAVLFDLGRGGVFGNRPTSDFGELALAAASDQPATGCVGAGTGAVCGGIKAGFGYAEKQLATGVSVAAGVVVNAVGSAVDATTGRLWADHMQSLATPTQTDREALADAYAETPAPLATTIGVVLTDAILSKAQASKLAAVAHDGMARAIRPIHSMVDGDTVFCLASDRRPVAEDPMRALFAFNTLLAAAADVFTDACLDAMLAATSRGSWKSYSDLAPSVLGVK
jgi:L-aminopeptidase/D-esterase-like protein